MTSHIAKSQRLRLHRVCCRFRHDRRGIVGIMFVVVFSLLIGTFVLALGRRSLAEHQRDVRRQTIRLLESAIKSAEQIEVPVEQEIRLPVDQTSDEWIEVRLLDDSDERRRYRATHRRGDRIGMSITRSESRSVGGE
ncbi:TadE/TadG family type IV pilus assembly protein [Roseiconus lacunae]|uniref:TadE/TadG family type IV pilus assembly protein n=1 Tax=Roseiconus lacunae TaxID=2605694 RepID=UPI0011F196F8|nr:hypothetical protein [Roseiconus lacunae]